MQITLLRLFAALAVTLGPVLKANACSFSMSQTIFFAPGVSSIKNQDRIDLAKKVIEANNSVARTGTVVVYGIAEANGIVDGNEKSVGRAKAITEKRVESVMAYLRTLGISESRFAVDYHAMALAFDAPASERFQVLVQFVPAPSQCG